MIRKELRNLFMKQYSKILKKSNINIVPASMQVMPVTAGINSSGDRELSLECKS